MVEGVTLMKEGGDFIFLKSSFCLFRGQIDLEEGGLNDVFGLGPVVDFIRQTDGIQGVDKDDMSDEVFYLVALELADKVPSDGLQRDGGVTKGLLVFL